MTTFLPLFLLVLALMGVAAPGRDHSALAFANASVLLEGAPLFRDDADRRRSAALLVAIEYRESGLRNDAVGDHGHSVCAMQIYDGPKSLLEDPTACVRTGMAMLRASIRADRDNPIAFYARGPNYQTEEARRISRDRVALARRLLAGVEGR